MMKTVAIFFGIAIFAIGIYLTFTAMVQCGWSSLLWGRSVFWAALFGFCS